MISVGLEPSNSWLLLSAAEVSILAELVVVRESAVVVVRFHAASRSFNPLQRRSCRSWPSNHWPGSRCRRRRLDLEVLG